MNALECPGLLLFLKSLEKALQSIYLYFLTMMGPCKCYLAITFDKHQEPVYLSTFLSVPHILILFLKLISECFHFKCIVHTV